MNRIWVIAVGLALLASAPASARDLPSETPDDVAWVNGAVKLLAANGSRTFVSGDFADVGDLASPGATVSAVSGAARSIAAKVGEIDQVIPDGAGGWYVGGRGHVHRLRADGSADPAFAVTIGAPEDVDLVSALALSPDGETLYIGGYYRMVNGEPRGSIAAVDADDGRLLPWRPDSMNRTWAIAVSPDGGTVFLAGSFWDGSESRALTVLDAATGARRALVGRETGNALAFAPDGRTLYLAFSYGPDGVLALDPVTLTERWRVEVGSPSDMVLTPDGRYLYVTQAPRDGVLRQIDTTTGTVTSWSTPLTAAGSIALSPDGETAYVGRAYAPGWPRAGAIAFATRDGALLGWAPGSLDRYTVDAVAISPDGAEVFLGGPAMLASRARSGTALLEETGRPTPWLEPGVDPDTAVGDVELDAQSTAYFTRYSRFASFRRDSVSALAADGTVRWRYALDGGSSLVLSRDEQTVYLTGSFTSIGGVARPGVAALRASDGAVLPWTLSITGGTAHSHAFSLDGATLYLGGTFTAINGVPREGLAAVDVATGTVLAFAPSLDGRVGNIKLAPDGGVLYVSGTFGDFEEQRHLLGLRVSDGAVVFDPPLDTAARSFVILADGQTVMVASDYDANSRRRPLTAWDAQTSTLLPWHVVNCVSCDINTLALDPDGRTLHVGGDFTWGTRLHYYMRLAVGRASLPSNTTPPRVIGDAQPGRLVECDPGAWTGHPSRYSYAWTLDDVPVAGFDGRELLLTPADAGRRVRCEVGAGAATAASAPVTVGSAAPPWTPAPRRMALPAGQEPTPTPTPTPTATPSPTPTATPTPTPSPTPTPTPTSAPSPAGGAPPLAAPLAGGPLAARTALPDRRAPRVSVRRAAGALRLTLSEAATVTVQLSSRRRTFALAAGRHTLTARRLGARLRGRVTLRARDAAGNARTIRLTV